MAFLIVTEKEQKEALYEVSMQQPAVKGAAAVIILLGDLTAYTVANADEISAKSCRTRNDDGRNSSRN